MTRDRIEAGFERWGRFVIRHPWWVIAAVLAFSFSLISQLPKLTLDMSTEGFLHPNDPISVTYNEFRDQFDRDDRLFIGIHTPDIFAAEFVTKLRSFHEAIENEVPNVDTVDSLINARSTRGLEDELIVEDLFEDWAGQPERLAAIREIAVANPLYRYLLFSDDLTYTAVSVKLATYSDVDEAIDFDVFEDTADPPQAPVGRRSYLTGEENNETVAAVREVMKRYAAPDFEFFLTGPPVFQERISLGVSSDMGRFLALAFVASGIFLFVLFRRPSGMLLPLVVVLLSLLTTLGWMPVLGIQIQLPTQVLPAFLMAVGVGDSVHILAIYYQRLRAGDERDEAIAQALRHSGFAVAMTTATTAVALFSFVAAEVAPIARLGILAPLGVTLAFVYTMTLIPALLAVLPVRAGSRARVPLASLGRALVALGDASIRNPAPVFALWFLVIVLGAFGAARLSFSHDPMDWFRPGDPVRVDTARTNEALRGAVTLEVLFDTGRENGLHDPALLKDLDAIKTSNADIEINGIFVGKTISLADILKEINRALNENDPAAYEIPGDRLLVAQELLLFENSGSDDLEDLVDSRFSVGRMTLKLPWVDAIAYPDLIDLISERYEEVVGDRAEIVVTGRVGLLGRTFKALISSLARSYALAFILITPLMILLLANFRWGLVSMLPNLAPILITLGLMGWFDFPLNGFTLLIGSIALGLAVDDTIHFLYHFQSAYERGLDARASVRETLETTGQALLFTTLVLCTGFFLFTLGAMQATFDFGVLTGFALVVAFLADVTLVPAIIGVLTRND